MVEIRLPAYVFEPNLAGYVAKLLDGSRSGSIIMDFEAVRFYIPAAIVATLAQIGNWQQNGQEISFRNHATNPVCGYLQRIDFFRKVGLELPEPGRRRNETGRFVPIEQISRRKGERSRQESRSSSLHSPILLSTSYSSVCVYPEVLLESYRGWRFAVDWSLVVRNALHPRLVWQNTTPLNRQKARTKTKSSGKR